MKKVGTEKLIIGSRESPLAQAQTRLVIEALEIAHPGIVTEIIMIKTTGDTVLDKPLTSIGGKGLFTKEIEAALLECKIDIAVHSAKDMETHLPAALTLAAVLPRGDPRDVFLSSRGNSLSSLPAGSVVGTTSPRRRAQILNSFPQLDIVSLRGNVETRIKKLRDGNVDAILLALAGLRRLRLSPQDMEVLGPEVMLPSAAQGTIGIESRVGDEKIADLLAPICHFETMQATLAERTLLQELGGSCCTPIGALAEHIPGGKMRLRALIADPNGEWLHRMESTAQASDAELLGRKMGKELRALVVESRGEKVFND